VFLLLNKVAKIKEKLPGKWSLLIGGILFSILFVLFLGGLHQYPGSGFLYTLFSVVFLSMLISGFCLQVSYGYMFLVVFLWLGYWLKLTIHTILSYPFVEPVGLFVGSSEAWDEVLGVATATGLGVMLGKLLFTVAQSYCGGKRGLISAVIPPWYPSIRRWLWGALVIIAITVYFLNWRYGVHVIGLAPRTVLMWPLNATIAWLLNIGLATGIAVLLWWDIALKKNLTFSVYAIIAEALCSSVSILSRSVYIFHAIPQLWVVYQYKHTIHMWSRIKTTLLAIMLVLFLIVSIAAVTTFRSYLYQSGVYSSTAFQVYTASSERIKSTINGIELQLKEKNISLAERQAFERRLGDLFLEKQKFELKLAEEKSEQLEAMKHDATQYKALFNEFGYQVSEGFAIQILNLSIDRWIGLEGLMAVQAYTEKSPRLFLRALFDKPKASEPDIFQTISNSIYLKTDGAKFRFATLPGAAGFLYYSNSIFIVMMGMIFLSFALLTVEFFIGILTRNPILCSLYGVVLATNVSQFGGSPRNNLPYFLMLICGILLVWLIQSKFFTQAFYSGISKNNSNT
jgi:hypothetical protein